MNPTIETLLDRVQKPGRYAGGELNSVVKDKAALAIRFAFRTYMRWGCLISG